MNDERQAPESWSGWHRRTPRARWRRLATMPTREACWEHMLRANLRGGGDTLVLRSDRDPNDDRKAR